MHREPETVRAKSGERSAEDKVRGEQRGAPAVHPQTQREWRQEKKRDSETKGAERWEVK